MFHCPRCKVEKPLSDEEINWFLEEYFKIVAGEPEYKTFGLIDGYMKPIQRGEDGQNG
jgi:hypothetical protein